MSWRSWFRAGLPVSTMLVLVSSVASAAAAPFDLPGPRLEIRITRAGRSLPISQVPNLQAGDEMWLHPDLPANESIHYLLIPVFLRGPLNPPPENWFTKVETWKPQVRKNGVNVQVPEGALEALIFLAPETGGGFNTVRTAVRSRPGVFVRAAQDLYAADLTRSRLDAYIDAVKKISNTDPTRLQTRSKLLSQTLYLKINTACFDLPPDQQEACLIQNPDNLVLNDAQSQSMVTALTSGAAGDMINQLSVSTAAGGGMYSPYVGAVVDMVRIVGSMHTAQYAYIPALSVDDDGAIQLKLSNPPSFSNPKSVMVASLPPVASVHFPMLRAVHPEELLCLERPKLVLSVEGAPLVFSTQYAHDLALHVQDSAGHSVDLPAAADAERGGFVVDARALQTSSVTGTVTGQLRGEWGFDPWNGPDFAFTNSRPQEWSFAAGETNAITAADKVSLHLQADSVVCVQGVTIATPQGKVEKAAFTRTPPRLLEVSLPVTRPSRGLYTLAVAEYGQTKPEKVPVHVYPPSAVVSAVTLHAGDDEAVMTGTHLQEVSSVEIGGVIFHTGLAKHSGAEDTLQMKTSTNLAGSKVFVEDAAMTAHVHLKDGRVLDVPITIAPPRPRVELLSKSIAVNSGGSYAFIRLGNGNDLPQYGHLNFFLKSVAPQQFPRDETVEVGAADGGFVTTLSLANNSLTLQDAQTVFATLDPAKAFGSSAFGPLRFRPMTAAGVPGDWQPLANLARLPELKHVDCPSNPVELCMMTGENLFLIDSVAATPQFLDPTAVPLGFAGNTMKVPRPNGTTLYLKLRDDPSTVDLVSLPVLPLADQN
ncbi:MAG: hypothetical protein ACYCOR_14460 [Acidobacteriaceae bacterium]